MLEREAGEIGRVIKICLADAGEARDKCANRHESGDKFIACILPKLFVDVDCDVISLPAEGKCYRRAAVIEERKANIAGLKWNKNPIIPIPTTPAPLLRRVR